MKGLRNRFERWCYKNRNIGIPNLMFYISIGTAIVYFMSIFDQSYILYNVLCFSRTAILQGQVWRLFSYVFTSVESNILFMVISLFCYYALGRSMEQSWGTFRFNLFYFTGVILLDIYGLIFNTYVSVDFLNLSLFLGFATMFPDAGFYLFLIIPIKAWFFALIYLCLTAIDVISGFASGSIVGGFFPLITLANYFLFFGKDVLNVIPRTWRMKLSKKKQAAPERKAGPIPFPNRHSAHDADSAPKGRYTHCCTVCGRTDISDPQLEFRYCSKCNGYHCYCENYINHHSHIE